MAFLTILLLVSCTVVPSGPMTSGDGTFLVDDARPCERVDHSGTIPAMLGNGGLAGVVAVVTTDEAYSSSSVWALDVATSRYCPLATGESGDLFLAPGGDGLALFSRRAPQLNFSVFTSFGRTTQQATPQAGNGDPHALRIFREENLVRWLVAYNTAGKLVEFDPSSPRDSVALVPAEFSGNAQTGRQFRPVDVLVVKGEELLSRVLKSTGGKATDDYVFALHQGLDAYYRANGTQAIFGWRRVGPGQYVEVDLDEARPGINGLPLRFTNPSGFIRAGDRLSMVSLCFSADPNCKKGIEYLDVIELGSINETHDASDLAVAPVFSNGFTTGGVPAGEDSSARAPGFAFASVQTSTGKKIVSFNLDSGAMQTIHSFRGEGSGFYGLAFDAKSSNLLIGDRDGARPLMWVYPVSAGGQAKGDPARFEFSPSTRAGQANPMQFVLLNKN
jgi:hypothetical protein